MERVTGFVLAGGKSSRMGGDKALLQFGDRTLLERALELANRATGEVKIVGDPAKYGTFGPVISDIYANRGPLGGIHAALTNSDTDLNLILATDLPFVAPAFLEYLITRARSTDALVTVPKLGKFFEPLCTVYRKTFGDIAREALSQGRNKLDALFLQNITRMVTEDEIVAAGFSATMFRNLNTPDDFVQAENKFPR